MQCSDIRTTYPATAQPGSQPGSYPTGPVYTGPPTEQSNTDNMSSNGGVCTYPPIMNNDKVPHGPPSDHMTGGPPYMGGWDGQTEGMAHYSYPGYSAYPPDVPPNGHSDQSLPHGVTVTMCNSGQAGDNNRGQHTVHFHVHQGEAVSLQLGEQVQMIQGPATVRMVSTSHEPPVPLPVQVPPGHFVQQIVDENGTLQHVILSQHPIYPPVGPQPNGNSQNGWQPPPSGPGYVDPANGAAPPSIPCTGPPPVYWNNNRAEGDQPRPSKNKNKNRDYNDRKYRNGKSSPSLSVQSTPPQSPVKPRTQTYNGRSSGGGWKYSSNVTVDDSDESGIGINNDEDQEEKQLLLEILSNIRYFILIVILFMNMNRVE